MPISCLAVAFSMRSRLPPIMVPCIACSAHTVHVQSPHRLLSTYYCRLFTTHGLTTRSLTHLLTCIAVSASSAVEKETNPKPLLTWLKVRARIGLSAVTPTQATDPTPTHPQPCT